MVTKILLGIIVLHLIAGFGWMIIKLSPKRGDEKLIDSSEDELN